MFPVPYLPGYSYGYLTLNFAPPVGNVRYEINAVFDIQKVISATADNQRAIDSTFDISTL